MSSSQLRAKKSYSLFPKPKKDLSIPEIKLNSKQKTKLFLQVQDIYGFYFFRNIYKKNFEDLPTIMQMKTKILKIC